MAFYNKKEQLYLETVVSVVGLATSLLQAKDEIQFPRNEERDRVALQSVMCARKSLTSAEAWYSNIE